MTAAAASECEGERRLGSAGRDRILDYCPDCGCFDLTFDTVRLRLAAASLLELARAAESLVEARAPGVEMDRRCCFIGIGGAATALRLRWEEVEVLQMLLSTGVPLARERCCLAAGASEWVH